LKSGSKPIKTIKEKKKYGAYDILGEIKTAENKRIREDSSTKNEEMKKPEVVDTKKIKPKLIEKYDQPMHKQ